MFSIIALITKENNPSVRIVMGKDSMVNIGLMMAFTNPNTRAAIRAAVKPLK